MNKDPGLIEAQDFLLQCALRLSTYDYVGLLKQYYIQLDFDTEVASEIILKIVEDKNLKCNILKTTKGIHAYFKVDDSEYVQKANQLNSIGLKVDIGLGSKYRPVPLKVDGKERQWVKVSDEIDVIPFYLRPIRISKDSEFLKGEYRNQSLFEYILTLNSNGFSKEEIREIINIINNYVFPTPLSQKEIDTITREEAFKEEKLQKALFYKDGKFSHNELGNYMLQNCNIALIDEQLSIYGENGLYSFDTFEIENAMLDIIEHLVNSQRAEVYKYLDLRSRRKNKYVKEYADPRFIGLKDYILDINTMEKLEYSPQIALQNKIPTGNYNPNSYDATVDKILNKMSCNDIQVRALMEEMIGACMYRRNLHQTAFILLGSGRNGKSTFLEMLKALLTKDNYSSVELRDLENEHKPVLIVGKTANIGDDIRGTYIDDSANFKKAVSGESFVINRKYLSPIDITLYATNIFSANTMPKTKDKGDGFLRRLTIIPFDAKLSKYDADYDPYILDKLTTPNAMEYLIKLGIEGLKRAIDNKAFTKSDRVEKELQEYKVENDSLLEWLQDEPKIINEVVADVYLCYKVWCSKYGYLERTVKSLSTELKKRGIVTIQKKIDGKNVRVYVEENN